ncbi:MAG TPA: hypothetical protein VHI51_21340 [Ktedonobacterales bacterium]|nr:hypothetical protein [Ktedonobacterales bacterium]
MIEQLEDSLPFQLRERLADGLAEHVSSHADHPLVQRIGDVKDVCRPVQVSDGCWSLHDQVVQALPLKLGALQRLSLASEQFRPLVLHPLVFDGEQSRSGDEANEVEVVLRRRTRLAIVHGECAKDAPSAVNQRRRPTRPQPVCEGQIAEVYPQRVIGDIFDNHRASSECGCATGTDSGADANAIDSPVVRFWQARSGAMQQMLAVLIEQQDRRQHTILRVCFDPARDRLQGLRERKALGDHLKNLRLSTNQRFQASYLRLSAPCGCYLGLRSHCY